MNFPTKKFCEACSIYHSCSSKMDVFEDFIDWEKFKQDNMPKSQTKRCDLILEADKRTYFIEMKVKDWLDENKKLKKDNVADVASSLAEELEIKFQYTYDEYYNIVHEVSKSHKYYSLTYSKEHTIYWRKPSLASSEIKRMLNTRIFPKFNKFDQISRTFVHKDQKIRLDARECSEIYNLIAS